MHSSSSKTLLEAAITAFLKTSCDDKAKLLYSLYYEQSGSGASEAALDLAFNDQLLDSVAEQWSGIMSGQSGLEFMRFEERAGMNEEDEVGEIAY